jgi:hypothetical protein
MTSENIIFDLVLTTSPDKFIPWFLDDWIMSNDSGRFTCASGEYTVELEYLEPDPAQEVFTHEITFIGKPFPSSKVNLINPDGSIKVITLDGVTDDREELALGFMLVWELNIEKIQVKGITLDYAEFDDYLMRIGEYISEIYSPIRKYIQAGASDLPVKPNGEPDELPVGSKSTFPEHNNTSSATKSSSKRGPVTYSDNVKLKAIRYWDSSEHTITLEEFLGQRFGTTNYRPDVKPSTFQGWRRQLRKKGLLDSK